MAASLPSEGAVFRFRTTSFFKSVPSTTNRFAALKVLGTDSKYVVTAVLSGVWTHPPSLDDARGCTILTEHRFSHIGRRAIWGISANMWDPSDLTEFEFLGEFSSTEEEQRLASSVLSCEAGTSISCLGFANFSAEGEWRWTNDRERFIAEKMHDDAQQAAKRYTERQRYENRLRGLTWEKLLAEVPFSRWSSTPPFPPPDFTQASRECIHRTCHALMALGKKPKRLDVRRALRECVEWFNNADDHAGGVIETEEREDICATLEELAHVAKQPMLVSEIKEWRTW